MSLVAEGINPVPEETARLAHAAYPKGNRFMHMRDGLGTIYQDESFAPLFSHTGQPAEAPWRLALVTIMPFAEGLSDLQDAVRGRIDWKYGLGLELAEAGFDASLRSRVPHPSGRRPCPRTALERDADPVQGARLAEPHAANNAPLRPMCWPRSERSIDSSVWEKRCALRSIVWLLWRLSGDCLIVSRNGWIAMGGGWKTLGCLRANKSVRPGPTVLDKME